jgi:hypothetical protein
MTREVAEPLLQLVPSNFQVSIVGYYFACVFDRVYCASKQIKFYLVQGNKMTPTREKNIGEQGSI